jgi:hypothetical protein
MRDFTFFSFEHYPYQDRRSYSWADLFPEPDYVHHIVQVWKDDGLPANVPFFMTEGNIGGGAPPSSVKAGLWLADYVGSMMAEGAGATYYFHYMPHPGNPGGFGNFLWIDDDYKLLGYPPQYLAAQLITKEWVQPIDAPHKQFKAASDVTDAAGHVLLTAYAVERPDGQWSVMLVNRDQSNDHGVKIAFLDGKADEYFAGPVERITFGSTEYQWHQEGLGGHADPDGPASRSTVTGGADRIYQMPKASITVLRGKLAR